MTNLQQLIERRQGEIKEVTVKIRDLSSETTIDLDIQPLLEHDAQTATEAYRQALLDVLAGLPEPSNPRGPWESGSSDGHNTALQTVRAQIEGLLNNTK
jgi:hypothetical protein